MACRLGLTELATAINYLPIRSMGLVVIVSHANALALDAVCCGALAVRTQNFLIAVLLYRVRL